MGGEQNPLPSKKEIKMEKVIQRGADHRYIVKKLGEDRYQVILQEYSHLRNEWYNVGTPDLYDGSGLTMLGITM